MDTLPLPEILGNPDLAITYSGRFRTVLTYGERGRGSHYEVPFDDLWLEFAEADGSSAPLPMGWRLALLYASGGGGYQDHIVDALVTVWTPVQTPPEGRFHALINELLFGSAELEDGPALPALNWAELRAERTRRSDLRRTANAERREMIRARRAREEAEEAARRAHLDALLQEHLPKMRAVGRYVRRMRLPEETPALVHAYDCYAVGIQGGHRVVDPNLYEGFEEIPSDTRTCKSCISGGGRE